jgi:alpha-methylacyl-CoA racemase
MEGTDVCFAPVLSIGEAPAHPHARARKAYVDVEGVAQPAPAPRFDRTPTATPTKAPARGAHTEDILAECGFDAGEIKALQESGAVV